MLSTLPPCKPNTALHSGQSLPVFSRFSFFSEAARFLPSSRWSWRMSVTQPSLTWLPAWSRMIELLLALSCAEAAADLLHVEDARLWSAGHQ